MNRALLRLMSAGCAVMLLLVSCHRRETLPVQLIPAPVSLEQRPGSFACGPGTQIIYQGGAEALGEAEYLATCLRIPTAYPWEVAEGAPGKDRIALLLDPGFRDMSGQESYSLEVFGSQAVVMAGHPDGLFRGIQTLLQLMPPEVFSPEPVQGVEWKIPCCRITDQPRFSWRGMHLDVSRHFFPVDFIKRYIDLIAMHRMNVFHWHLTDDNGWRIEIKKYPLLTEVSAWRVDREDEPWRSPTPPKPGEPATYGGFYTQEEIREIVQYAADRHITVIPEIEMPGHTSEVFAAYPELSCTGKKLYVQPGSYWPNNDIFCAGKEETFEFLENVLTEVMALFPSEYIHIGGDEADKTRWKACPLCRKRILDEGLADEDELQSWFIKRMEMFLQSKGRKLIGWDEILEGGLAPEATVMSWRGFEGGFEAARQGHDVVMCPTSYCYFDYYQADPDFEPEAIGGFTTLKKVYSFEPVPEGLSGTESRHILGGQGNVWTEFIPNPEHAGYMALPRMTALAEALWSPKELRNWDNFRSRLDAHFKRLDQMKVNYSKGSWKVDIRPDIQPGGSYGISLETEQPGYPVHYTLDGSDPTTTSPLYDGPLTIDTTTAIKAVIFVDGFLKEKVSSKTVHFHLATGKRAFLKTEPSERYFGNGVNSLVDGMTGSGSFRDGYWIGFEGKDLELEIDLGTDMPVQEITAGFFQQTGAWIFMPAEVTFILVPSGGDTVASVTEKPETTTEAIGAVTEPVTAVFDNIHARFVRVHARNMGACPSWHEGAGNPAWLFADEVIVR
ncbi:MAG: family 20 glycosylhydrolase [Bacteroidales bacterium]|nr:family 20 glycosylhydrolase [Bacteroidales bacterium]